MVRLKNYLFAMVLGVTIYGQALMAFLDTIC